MPLMIVENGIGLHETPDENGMVQDDARIAYLRAHIAEIKKAVDEDGSTSSAIAPGAPSASSPPAAARWRNATASSTSTRTTMARERSRAPKHTASRQPLTCPEASGHHTITSLTTFRSCQADEPPKVLPYPPQDLNVVLRGYGKCLPAERLPKDLSLWQSLKTNHNICIYKL